MKQPGVIEMSRRDLLTRAALSAGAAMLTPEILHAETVVPSAGAGGNHTNNSFGAIKQVEAGVLNVGYVEAGPSNGALAAYSLRRASSGFSRMARRAGM
jgi:hypothetical protein